MPSNGKTLVPGGQAADEANLRHDAAESLVTIVVSFRERWRLTPQTIENILRNTAGPCEIWLLDSGMPTDVRDAVEPYHKAGSIKIMDIGRGTLPNHGRAKVAPLIQTKYAVFIDNDVLVSPHWLEKLVACAEETGAGIVGPLYLWGRDGGADLIHMAGGDLAIIEETAGRRMADTHRHSMRKASEVAQELIRQPCDFAEYHCMLMRREVFAAKEVFDPDIVTVHEHIHASLVAKEMGYGTWFEPDAKVNYLAFSPWLTHELEEFRRRWAIATAQSSLQHFARRWNVIDDADFSKPIHGFMIRHFSRVDLLDPHHEASITRHRLMARTDLQQNFSGLELMAHDRGYRTEEILFLAKSYRLMMELCNGIFRPCGRPFINHLVGTASVLLFYGCGLRVTVAGMLHAAFSHGRSRRSADNDRAIINYLATLGPLGQDISRTVQLYDARTHMYHDVQKSGVSAADLPVQSAEIYLIEVANDIDMHLSLEVAVSGRGDVLKGESLAYCRQVVEQIGLPALAATLSQVRDEAIDLPKVRFQNEFSGSFLLDQGRALSAVRRH